MGATVHFVGITIYAIFASGELQPWAETAVEEPQPMKSLDQETTFVSIHKLLIMFSSNFYSFLGFCEHQQLDHLSVVFIQLYPEHSYI